MPTRPYLVPSVLLALRVVAGMSLPASAQALAANGQSSRRAPVVTDSKGRLTLTNALTLLRTHYSISLLAEDQVVGSCMVSRPVLPPDNPKKALKMLLAPLGLVAEQVNSRTLVVVPDKKRT